MSSQVPESIIAKILQFNIHPGAEILKPISLQILDCRSNAYAMTVLHMFRVEKSYRNQHSLYGQDDNLFSDDDM